jgi:hypothetical protein
MINTIIGGIILGVIMGLWKLAYRHPKPFKSLASNIGGIAIFVLITWKIFIWGGDFYLELASKSIPKETMDGLRNGFVTKMNYFYNGFLVCSIFSALYGALLWNFTAKLDPSKKEESEGERNARELMESYVETNKKREQIRSIKVQTLEAEIGRLKFDLERADFALDKDRVPVLRSELAGKVAELEETKKEE